ncbi:MAG TPA: hypothetical protein V6C85_08905 [Allocoleopsis sp.]
MAYMHKDSLDKSLPRSRSLVRVGRNISDCLEDQWNGLVAVYSDPEEHHIING